MTTTDNTAPASDRELVLTRLINAPREMLYRAWTEPDLMKQWFAPAPWTTPIVETDVRPGGASLIVMCGPDGNEFPNLASLGSVVDNIGRDCNEKRQDPTTVHDLCERKGDHFASGAASSEIAWIELADPVARNWRVHLRDTGADTLGAVLHDGGRHGSICRQCL